MINPFVCAVVCPPPRTPLPDTDPFSDRFSFKKAQVQAVNQAEAALQLAEKAAYQGADIIVLPEDIHGIRPFWRVFDSANVMRRLAEPIPGPTTKTARNIARRNKAYIILTLYENSHNSIFNTVLPAPC